MSPRVHTYTNPVYPNNFPDPFVLRHRGRYFAYGTGPAPGGRYFPMLVSRDLVAWEERGGALPPLELGGAEEYWAPEVAYRGGHSYMYFATGRAGDPDHHLRLATADHPLGPWSDSGVNLSPQEPFAIDAHPFQDPRDGAWYLFYARDVHEPPYAGTGIVVDRLLEMHRLEGRPRTVIRPHADWHVFELKRLIKQGLDWYTVEGPFVLTHDGRYVCLYSGGRWENPNYGVGYAIGDTPLGPWIDEWNSVGPAVLTTVPGCVIGPGHNCVVTGPDLVTPWIVYHGWDAACSGRLLRIDPLEWMDGHPRVSGPSHSARPAPGMPDVAAWLDESGPGPDFEPAAGDWAKTEEGLLALSPAARLALRIPETGLTAEVWFRGGAGEFGIDIGPLPVRAGAVSLRAGDSAVSRPHAGAGAWSCLRVTRRAARVTATLDGYPTVEAACPAGPAAVAVVASHGTEVSYVGLTRGVK